MLPCPRRAETGYQITEPTEDVWTNDRTCSYCGSLRPALFFDAVRDNDAITPTDKDYKVYVGKGNGKFYFQHLNRDEQIKFVDLLNRKKINMVNPFYVLPFFVRQGKDAVNA